MSDQIKTENIYVKNGYANRREYLHSLADEFGVSYSIVTTYAAMLGPSEDFDGLVTHLEDEFECGEG
jgi:hypothetical protein